MTSTQQRFLKLIAQFGKAKILVIGDLMLDEWIWGKVSRISPEAPVPVVQVEKRTYSPGGASNVAANLRSLGATTSLAGLIGSDDPGKILKRELRKFGVDLHGIISVKNRPTTLKTRIIAHNQQVVRADVEVQGSLDGKFTKKMIGLCGSIFNQIDALLFSDYNKGFIHESLVEPIKKLALSKGKMIIAGAKPSNLSLFTNVNLIVLNQAEAEQALGKEIKNDRELELAGYQLLKRLQAKAVIITRGEHGMALFENGMKMVSIPSRASEVYDVSGAGDTFIAVATLALAAGASMEEAAHLANHGAGVVVTKVGTATVSRKELEETFS